MIETEPANRDEDPIEDRDQAANRDEDPTEDRDQAANRDEDQVPIANF